MQDKNGANKVKMRADHYYMLRRYQEAYEIAKEYCEIVASNDVRSVQGDGGLSRSSTITDAGAAGVLKVTDSKELQEMAVRCALKLGKTDEAAKLADELVHLPNSNMLELCVVGTENVLSTDFNLG